MRHSASLTLTLPGDVVLREPTSFERVKKFFLPASMAPDLSTDERQLDRNLVSLTEGLCEVLRDVDVNDAVYLAVDGRTVYYDIEGVPNDAEKLLEAAKDHFLPDGFRELRAVFMQRQEGLELLYESTFRRRFREDAPAAFLAVSARLGALRPHAGESIAESKARLRTVLRDRELSTSLRTFFDEIIERLRKSLERVFPGGRVARSETSTFVVRPAPHVVRELAKGGLVEPGPRLRNKPVCYHETRGWQPYYDPWDCYFLDHGSTWVALSELSEFMGGAWKRAAALAIDLIDSSGVRLCQAHEAGAHGKLFSGISELASQDFAAADLSSLSTTVETCIFSLPDAGVAEGAQGALPNLFELSAAGQIDLPADAISDVLSIGSDASSAVADAGSSIVDAVSDFDFSFD